jgi:hypothetical protein
MSAIGTKRRLFLMLGAGRYLEQTLHTNYFEVPPDRTILDPQIARSPGALEAEIETSIQFFAKPGVLLKGPGHLNPNLTRPK